MKVGLQDERFGVHVLYLDCAKLAHWRYIRGPCFVCFAFLSQIFPSVSLNMMNLKKNEVTNFSVYWVGQSV